MKKAKVLLTTLTIGFAACSAGAVANLGALGAAMPGGQAGSSAAAGGADFSGFYMGLAVGVNHNSSKIGDSSFKKTGVAPGVYMGYGTTFGKVYAGGELDVDYSFTTAKVTTYKMRSTYNAGLVGRVGGVINGAYLPYFRLGLGSHGYKYTAGTTTKSIHVFYVAPGVGFEAMLGSILLRLEGGYALAMSTTGITKSSVKTKPSRAFVKAGLAYKF